MRSAPRACTVPFVDLQPSNHVVRERILHRIGELIDRGDFTAGEAVAEFEQQFADYQRRRHCVGVASGTDALRLSLLASGLAPGGGVVVPASTFAATVEAVIQAGGAPILVDVDVDDYTIDVGQAGRAAAGDGATHVIPVHLYGQMADMRRLASLADAHGLQIVEDACQAHGARRDGWLAGSIGQAAAFSFYPSKNLGAMGDAGAIVTDDEELAARARSLRAHGERRKYYHEQIGYTARLDTLQAVVLIEKLPLLEEWNRQRRAAADFYARALSGLEPLHLPVEREGSESVWHLYVVLTADPEELAEHLRERGVQTGRHYPVPVHLAPAFRDLGFAPGDFPVAETLAREGLSLPLYPGITESQLEWVCEAVHDYFRRK
ncbi:MAG TPA: DegT/DnrJ/EryC1/StrS family aminotransferase [Gaiellaceae bacterium]|nr:DegT/DnrJ/EryC1/StrS family aminotransferase [Gaiellaceae bacterium]